MSGKEAQRLSVLCEVLEGGLKQACLLAGLLPTLPTAVAVATITVAAQDDLDAATRTQVQAGGLVHAHPGTTEVPDGIVPARHTAVASPSPARCRARYGRQASRRVKPLPRPPSSAWTALYRGVPPAPRPQAPASPPLPEPTAPPAPASLQNRHLTGE